MSLCINRCGHAVACLEPWSISHKICGIRRGCLSEILITLLPPQWLGYRRPCCKLVNPEMMEVLVRSIPRRLRAVMTARGGHTPIINRKSKASINYNVPWKVAIQFSLRFVKYDWIISETSPYDFPSISAIFHLRRFRIVSTWKSSLFFFQQSPILVLCGVS